MNKASDHLRRVWPALLSVAVVGALVALFALATGRGAVVPIAVFGAVLAALVVIVSEFAVSVIGDAPEFALPRMMAGMAMRGAGAVAGIAGAILVCDCEPRTVALVALPIYFAMLCGEVWEAIRNAPKRSTPAPGSGPRIGVVVDG